MANTIADKLQGLVNGKQYVIDKVNAKSGSNLTITSKWQDIGDSVDELGSSGGSSKSLKPYLDIKKSAYELFHNCVNLTNEQLAEFIPTYDTTSNVTLMGYMFYNCSNLTEIPQFDTSKATGMSYLFYGCKNITSIPLLDTSQATTTSYMFNNCSALISVPQLNISKSSSISYMFNGCSQLITIPPLDTIKVTGMGGAFKNCYNLTKVDISYYKATSSSYSQETCWNCYSLKAFIIRSFGSSYSFNTNCFGSCYHFTGTQSTQYNPNGDKDGYIYVPRDMIETLSSATNWSTYADRFRALEDYTKDGTTTGEFDDEKAGL